MSKKYILALAVAVLCASGVFAQGIDMGKQYAAVSDNLRNEGSFFLPNKLGKTNLDNILLAAYNKSSAANYTAEDLDKAVIDKLNSFNFEREVKNIKPETEVIKIDYSRTVPHLSKRKITKAVMSEYKAAKELSLKKAELQNIADNFAVLRAKYLKEVKSISAKRSFLGSIDTALASIKNGAYSQALEATNKMLK